MGGVKMNENLNLVEILEGCPKGTELYSTVYGKVRFERISNYDLYPIEVNYPQTKDLLASDFIEECPFKRLGLLSSPSV